MDYQEFMEEVDSKIISRMEDLDQEVKEYWEFRATHPYDKKTGDIPLHITSRLKRSIVDIEELSTLYFKAYAAGNNMHLDGVTKAMAYEEKQEADLEAAKLGYEKFLSDRAHFPEWAE